MIVEIVVFVFEIEYNRMIDALEIDFHGLIQIAKATSKVVDGVKETAKGVGAFVHNTATGIAGLFNKNKNKTNNS
ncbi:MAG: hypothetical protein IJW64_02690 [Clostridia bacterium]|nr:hypothetical protein [Clostridia bacterium]